MIFLLFPHFVLLLYSDFTCSEKQSERGYMALREERMVLSSRLLSAFGLFPFNLQTQKYFTFRY